MSSSQPPQPGAAVISPVVTRWEEREKICSCLEEFLSSDVHSSTTEGVEVGGVVNFASSCASENSQEGKSNNVGAGGGGSNKDKKPADGVGMRHSAILPPRRERRGRDRADESDQELDDDDDAIATTEDESNTTTAATAVPATTEGPQMTDRRRRGMQQRGAILLPADVCVSVKSLPVGVDLEHRTGRDSLACIIILTRLRLVVVLKHLLHLWPEERGSDGGGGGSNAGDAGVGNPDAGDPAADLKSQLVLRQIDVLQQDLAFCLRVLALALTVKITLRDGPVAKSELNSTKGKDAFPMPTPTPTQTLSQFQATTKALVTCDMPLETQKVEKQQAALAAAVGAPPRDSARAAKELKTAKLLGKLTEKNSADAANANEPFMNRLTFFKEECELLVGFIHRVQAASPRQQEATARRSENNNSTPPSTLESVLLPLGSPASSLPSIQEEDRQRWVSLADASFMVLSSAVTYACNPSTLVKFSGVEPAVTVPNTLNVKEFVVDALCPDDEKKEGTKTTSSSSTSSTEEKNKMGQSKWLQVWWHYVTMDEFGPNCPVPMSIGNTKTKLEWEKELKRMEKRGDGAEATTYQEEEEEEEEEVLDDPLLWEIDIIRKTPMSALPYFQVPSQRRIVLHTQEQREKFWSDVAAWRRWLPLATASVTLVIELCSSVSFRGKLQKVGIVDKIFGCDNGEGGAEAAEKRGPNPNPNTARGLFFFEEPASWKLRPRVNKNKPPAIDPQQLLSTAKILQSSQKVRHLRRLLLRFKVQVCNFITQHASIKEFCGIETYTPVVPRMTGWMITSSALKRHRIFSRVAEEKKNKVGAAAVAEEGGSRTNKGMQQANSSEREEKGADSFLVSNYAEAADRLEEEEEEDRDEATLVSMNWIDHSEDHVGLCLDLYGDEVFAEHMLRAALMDEAAWALSHISDDGDARMPMVVSTPLIYVSCNMLTHPLCSNPNGTLEENRRLQPRAALQNVKLMPALRLVGNFCTGSDVICDDVIRTGCLDDALPRLLHIFSCASRSNTTWTAPCGGAAGAPGNGGVAGEGGHVHAKWGVNGKQIVHLPSLQIASKNVIEVRILKELLRLVSNIAAGSTNQVSWLFTEKSKFDDPNPMRGRQAPEQAEGSPVVVGEKSPVKDGRRMPIDQCEGWKMLPYKKSLSEDGTPTSKLRLDNGRILSTTCVCCGGSMKEASSRGHAAQHPDVLNKRLHILPNCVPALRMSSTLHQEAVWIFKNLSDISTVEQQMYLSQPCLDNCAALGDTTDLVGSGLKDDITRIPAPALSSTTGDPSVTIVGLPRFLRTGGAQASLSSTAPVVAPKLGDPCCPQFLEPYTALLQYSTDKKTLNLVVESLGRIVENVRQSLVSMEEKREGGITEKLQKQLLEEENGKSSNNTATSGSASATPSAATDVRKTGGGGGSSGKKSKKQNKKDSSSTTATEDDATTGQRSPYSLLNPQHSNANFFSPGGSCPQLPALNDGGIGDHIVFHHTVLPGAKGGTSEPAWDPDWCRTQTMSMLCAILNSDIVHRLSVLTDSRHQLKTVNAAIAAKDSAASSKCTTCAKGGEKSISEVPILSKEIMILGPQIANKVISMALAALHDRQITAIDQNTVIQQTNAALVEHTRNKNSGKKQPRSSPVPKPEPSTRLTNILKYRPSDEDSTSAAAGEQHCVIMRCGLSRLIGSPQSSSAATTAGGASVGAGGGGSGSVASSGNTSGSSGGKKAIPAKLVAAAAAASGKTKKPASGGVVAGAGNSSSSSSRIEELDTDDDEGDNDKLMTRDERVNHRLSVLSNLTANLPQDILNEIMNTNFTQEGGAGPATAGGQSAPPTLPPSLAQPPPTNQATATATANAKHRTFAYSAAYEWGSASSSSSRSSQTSSGMTPHSSTSPGSLVSSATNSTSPSSFLWNPNAGGALFGGDASSSAVVTGPMSLVLPYWAPKKGEVFSVRSFSD